MLATIRVKNFALVEDTELHLGPGLTVFTGETGAGKSLLLNAIFLLLGNRASASWVRKGATKAEVEGQFVLTADHERLAKLAAMGFEIEAPEDCLVVRREFGASDSGPSRIWIQGKAATRAQLQSALGDLIEVSGQHEFLKLNRSGYILDILDSLSDTPDAGRVYREVYGRTREVENELLGLREVSIASDATLEFLRGEAAELKEICKAQNLEELEITLERQAKELSSREKILEQLQYCSTLIEGGGENSVSMNDLLRNLDREAKKLGVLVEAGHILTGIDELGNQLSEIEEMVGVLQEKWSDETANADEILESLSQLRRNKRKYNVQSAGELKQVAAQKEAELRTVEGLLGKKDNLQKQLKVLQTELRLKATKLSAARKKVADKFVRKWELGIRELGMPYAALALNFAEADELGPCGLDDVELFFSSNKGHEMMPLSKVASGGELSRILLSLKGCIAAQASVGVYLFDEVDTGIGGETGHIVGKKLASLGRESQVLVVTHLPQIAAFANQQIRVEKVDSKTEASKSTLTVLKREERLEELARMLGGQKMTSARKLAEDLVKRVRSELSA